MAYVVVGGYAAELHGSVRRTVDVDVVPDPARRPRHLDVLGRLLGTQPSVRLVTDAHLAAIAIEHGLEIRSRDRDFARWSADGLRSRDPLT